jgi:CBS domain-containing protein
MSEVLRRFTDSKIRCLVVTEDMALKGMLTLRDVVAFIDERGASALDGTVADAMTTSVFSVTPDSSVDEAEAIFNAKRFHHLPVVEDGIVAGVVTPPDVLKKHLEDMQVTNDLLKDYCSGVYS